jgi:hypothetical protein
MQNYKFIDLIYAVSRSYSLLSHPLLVFGDRGEYHRGKAGYKIPYTIFSGLVILRSQRDLPVSCQFQRWRRFNAAQLCARLIALPLIADSETSGCFSLGIERTVAIPLRIRYTVRIGDNFRLPLSLCYRIHATKRLWEAVLRLARSKDFSKVYFVGTPAIYLRRQKGHLLAPTLDSNIGGHHIWKKFIAQS